MGYQTETDSIFELKYKSQEAIDLMFECKQLYAFIEEFCIPGVYKNKSQKAIHGLRKQQHYNIQLLTIKLCALMEMFFYINSIEFNIKEQLKQEYVQFDRSIHMDFSESLQNIDSGCRERYLNRLKQDKIEQRTESYEQWFKECKDWQDLIDHDIKLKDSIICWRNYWGHLGNSTPNEKRREQHKISISTLKEMMDMLNEVFVNLELITRAMGHSELDYTEIAKQTFSTKV